MDIFFNRTPCVFCGAKGKKTGAYIEGARICAECYGTVDIDDTLLPATIQKFAVYRAYREANSTLAARFQKNYEFRCETLSETPVFDYANHWFCLSDQLDRTIFTAGEVTAFTAAEDNHIILHGTAAGLHTYGSDVTQRMKRLLPVIERANLERQRLELLEQIRGGGQEDTASRTTRVPEVPRPFDKFIVRIELNHAYWDEKTLTIDAPRFDRERPSSAEYMRLYNEQIGKLRELAQALMKTAFPQTD